MIEQLRGENGFTLAELLIASVVTVIVLGGAVALTSQIQNGYRRQIEDSAGEQEARYALEWIARYLRGAGHDPFGADDTTCTASSPGFEGIVIDPNGDLVYDDVTLQMDSNPPDDSLGGADCDQSNEHVTISFCSPAAFATDLCPRANTIQFTDNIVGAEATTRTDNVIDNLEFEFLDRNGAPTLNNASVVFVRVRITIRTRTIDASSGLPATRVLESEIRVRER